MPLPKTLARQNQVFEALAKSFIRSADGNNLWDSRELAKAIIMLMGIWLEDNPLPGDGEGQTRASAIPKGK